MTPQYIIALIGAVDSTAAKMVATTIHPSSFAAKESVRARLRIWNESYELDRAVDKVLVTRLSRQQSIAANDLCNDYLERNNRARTAIAGHKAKWNRVAMRAASSDYRAELVSLGGDQAAYRRWLKAEFVPKAVALLNI